MEILDNNRQADFLFWKSLYLESFGEAKEVHYW